MVFGIPYFTQSDEDGYIGAAYRCNFADLSVVDTGNIELNHYVIYGYLNSYLNI